jgi:hypothetical protein
MKDRYQQRIRQGLDIGKEIRCGEQKEYED